MLRNLADYIIIPFLTYEMLWNLTNYATMLPFDFRGVTEPYGLCINIFFVFRHVPEFHKLPNDGCQAPYQEQTKVACHQAKVPGRN